MVINARDAMPNGGKVTIETTDVQIEEDAVRKYVGLSPGPHVMVIVRDTGEGIASDLLHQVFEPFFTTKELGKGTGLGLSMVYGFVRQSGGAICVDSEPGHGATFSLLFPATKELPETFPLETKSAQHTGDETILVVEDDESVRQLIVHVLREAGYTVLETANAREAMPLGREYAGRIDLMVTDVIMPGLSGVELAEQLMPIRRDMHILFISGYTQVSVLEGGKFPSGSEFLRKPFSREDLLYSVRKLLDTMTDAIVPKK